MTVERVERRLAAILATDVVGYSRLMGADEEGTLARLDTLQRDYWEPKLGEYRGRIVKRTGDGALIEFSSVIDAARYAAAIQRDMLDRNKAIPDEKRIQLRMGLHIGDIIIQREDIFGDGVNIAARLEGIAKPGGICFSRAAYEQLKGKLDVAFEDGNEQQLKNIAQPVRVYHVKFEALAATSVVAFDTPSIAVLPFTNMSGDPDQEYFSDGITEDIITDLSKIAGLLVIARNSSFAYKGKSVDVRTIGRELGVRSILEGSIRRNGNRVRITAQLIDASNGGHLWADRCARELTDIFAVQDEVTRHIVEALKVKLTSAEVARIADIPTKIPEAHDLFLRGRELIFSRKWTRDVFDKLVAFMTSALELDPNYAEPYAGLAFAHNQDFHNNLTGSANALDVAKHYAKIAVEKGPTVPFVHWVAAAVALWNKDFEFVKQQTEIALSLNPNYALACGTRGNAETYSGHPLAAIPFYERAMRLDPGFTQQYMHFLGTAYLVAAQYDVAAATFRERIRLAPDTDLSRGLLISALGHLDHMEEAHRVWAELKQKHPNYSFAGHLSRLPLSNSADSERIRDGFFRTGVHE